MTSQVDGAACPHCRHTDCVADVPSVFAKNRSVRIETRHTIDIGDGWTTSDEHIEVLTPLGEQLRPPPAPTKRSHPGISYDLGAGLVVFVAVTIGLMLVPFVLVVPVFLRDALLPDSYLGLPPRVVLALGLIGLIALPIAAALTSFLVWHRRRFKRRLAEHELEERTYEAVLLPSYTRSRAWWECLQCCAADNLVFEQGAPAGFPVDELQRRLLERGARPT